MTAVLCENFNMVCWKSSHGYQYCSSNYDQSGITWSLLTKSTPGPIQTILLANPCKIFFNSNTGTCTISLKIMTTHLKMGTSRFPVWSPRSVIELQPHFSWTWWWSTSLVVIQLATRGTFPNSHTLSSWMMCEMQQHIWQLYIRFMTEFLFNENLQSEFQTWKCGIHL